MSQSFPDREETTRGGTPRLLAPSQPPLSADVHEAVGQLMAETVRQGRKLDTLNTDVGTIASEVRITRRELQDDRGSLVAETSKKTSARTSNRMATLLGALFVLYTEAVPLLHELWRSVHR